MVAIRNNKALKAFYEKLTKNGKLKMIAIVAVMRKLLIIINNDDCGVSISYCLCRHRGLDPGYYFLR
jgi:hypothetical protein